MGRKFALGPVVLLLLGASCLGSPDNPNKGTTGSSQDASTDEGSTTCTGAACTAGCPTGFADCDGDKSNGCETGIDSDIANCGACGLSCGSAHTSSAPACTKGVCAIACAPGYLHCAADGSQGCETAEDATNCGTCGHGCGDAACTDSVCASVLIATNQKSPMGISIDTGNIYWAENGANLIRRAGLTAAACDGAACTSIADTTTAKYRGSSGNGKIHPVATASDGATVFFTCNDTNAGVLSVGAGGGTDVILSGGGTGQSFSVVVDGAHVFYTNRTGTTGISMWDKSGIHDPVDGTSDSAGQTPASDALTSNSGRLYFADTAQGLIFVRNESDFYNASLTPTPCDMTQGGVAPVCMATVTAPSVQHVAVGGGFLYWSETTSQTIHRYKLLDQTSATVATAQNVSVLAADTTGVYWGRMDDSSFRYAKSSDAPCAGSACQIAIPVGIGTSPSGLAIDAANIYVSFLQTSGPNTGAILRRAR